MSVGLPKNYQKSDFSIQHFQCGIQFPSIFSETEDRKERFAFSRKVLTLSSTRNHQLVINMCNSEGEYEIYQPDQRLIDIVRIGQKIQKWNNDDTD